MKTEKVKNVLEGMELLNKGADGYGWSTFYYWVAPKSELVWELSNNKT